MDLLAYLQIDKVDKILKESNIDIPRVRGYRIMENEKIVSKSNINNIYNSIAINIVKDLCSSVPFWDDKFRVYDEPRKVNKYLNGDIIRWENIHGKKRKILKFKLKKLKKNLYKQYNIFNKHVGEKNVIYVHSRMGGSNWKYYADKNSILSQSWFIEKVDDCFDNTYCDFYVKINIPNKYVY